MYCGQSGYFLNKPRTHTHTHTQTYIYIYMYKISIVFWEKCEAHKYIVRTRSADLYMYINKAVLHMLLRNKTYSFLKQH